MLLQSVEGQLARALRQSGLLVLELLQLRVDSGAILALCGHYVLQGQLMQLLVLRQVLSCDEARVLAEALVAFLRLQSGESLLVVLHVDRGLPDPLVDRLLDCFQVDQRLVVDVELLGLLL